MVTIDIDLSIGVLIDLIDRYTILDSLYLSYMGNSIDINDMTINRINTVLSIS